MFDIHNIKLWNKKPEIFEFQRSYSIKITNKSYWRKNVWGQHQDKQKRRHRKIEKG